MRRQGHLFEGIAGFEGLCAAARRAGRGLTQRPAVAGFLVDLEPEVLALQRELLNGSYRPRPLASFAIADPKPRIIRAAAFRDRVVHHSLCTALELSFERFADLDSYACRPGKGNHAAVTRVQRLGRRHPWYARLDVARFFDSVDHSALMAQLLRRFKDRRALALAEVILSAGSCTPGRGLPIGNLTSQHFANFYLGHLDQHARQRLRPAGWVRYMDDVVLFGPDRDALKRQVRAVEAYLGAELRLALREDATAVAPVSAGIPFLGLRVWPLAVRLDGRTARRFRRRMRALERGYRRGDIDECARLRSAAGMIGWTEQADAHGLRRALFARMRRDGLLTD
jgi:RNA-directed DNA polymerase